jgi:hypothetical protein
MAAMGMSPRVNLDGFINIRGGDVCYGYTQVFRNGIVEATRAEILRDFKNSMILPAGSTTQNIIEVVPGFLDGLRSLDVPAPIVLMVTYQGVAGAKLGLSRYEHRLDEIDPFPLDEPLFLPEMIINDYGSTSDHVAALRPIFDALWNAAGFFKCTHYDDQGNWKPPAN